MKKINLKILTFVSLIVNTGNIFASGQLAGIDEKSSEGATAVVLLETVDPYAGMSRQELGNEYDRLRIEISQMRQTGFEVEARGLESLADNIRQLWNCEISAEEQIRRDVHNWVEHSVSPSAMTALNMRHNQVSVGRTAAQQLTYVYSFLLSELGMPEVTEENAAQRFESLIRRDFLRRPWIASITLAHPDRSELNFLESNLAAARINGANLSLKMLKGW